MNLIHQTKGRVVGHSVKAWRPPEALTCLPAAITAGDARAQSRSYEVSGLTTAVLSEAGNCDGICRTARFNRGDRGAALEGAAARRGSPHLGTAE